MTHRRISGAYLPRISGGYLPRVGAISAMHNLSQYTDPTGAQPNALGAYLAQVDAAKNLAFSTTQIDTPPMREALFLPATLKNAPVGASTITVVPACDFQAEELTVAANAGNFNITGVRIGMRPLFAADGPIPASQFAPNSLASRACAGLVRAGTPIQINIDCLVASDFYATFSGSALV